MTRRIDPATLIRHALSQPGRALCGQEVSHRGPQQGPHTFVVVDYGGPAHPDRYEDYCTRLGNKMCGQCHHLLQLRLT